MYKGHVVVDGHADILYRMETEGYSFYDPNTPLHQGYGRLLQSGVDVQVFVTFVMPEVTPSEQLYKVLSSLHRFQTDVRRFGVIDPIYRKEDLNGLVQEGKKGALLSLEGADCLNGQMSVLHALFQLGIRLIGLTWNGANCVGDGVGETRGGGLTQFGREVVSRMEELGMLVDVSHLSHNGVQDVLDISTRPVIASHSNAAAVYPHRRNLPDDLIRGIARGGGVVGATFVPSFIGSGDELCVEDFLRHVDHLLYVAGEDGVALGSDFDGIEATLIDLRHGGDYPFLLKKMEHRYGLRILAKMIGTNLLRVLNDTLPQ